MVTKVAVTDAEGRYEISELPAGRYTVTAAKSGYVSVSYGQLRPFEQGTLLEISQGQLVEKLNLVLLRGGVITGQVLDDYGDPVTQATVTALRYQYMAEGERRLVPVGISMATDDLGQFRLYGLAPGGYVVSAAANAPGAFVMWVNGTMLSATSGERDEVRANRPTYYPGTTNMSEAVQITVRAAEETGGVVFSLVPAQSWHIFGTVLNSHGQVATRGRVILWPIDSSTATVLSRGGEILPDGTFTISGVDPGMYTLETHIQEGEAGVASVTISDRDISGVVIQTGSGLTVRGRVLARSTDGRSPDLTAIRIVPMNTTSGARFYSSPEGVVNENGEFELHGIMGQNVFRINGLPRGWTLRTMTLDRDDVTDRPYSFERSSAVPEMQVVLTNRQTEISGSVTNSLGRAVRDFVVVALPAELKDGVLPRRFIRTVRGDQNGQFLIRDLPPERYVLAALPSLERGREWDPEVQSELRKIGKVVTLTEGQALLLELRLLIKESR